jgi:putative CocE/NonD family hydrolase
MWTAAARLQQPNPAERFDVRDVMIPTRDGVRLHTKVFVPKQPSGPLPIIMKRTPYGVDNAAGNFTTYMKALADEGYIFAFQDIRGKFGSEGTFVMQRPARDPGDAKALDEGTDTYDTIDWLLKNVPGNNGRVGMLGVSYDGWTTIMGALEPHPALKAISPQASPADMWLGDDFHHNGALRLSYAFEYAAMMESGKDVQQFAFDRYDTYEWYLSLGPLANANRKYLHERIPTWNDYVAHPDYDAFWKRQTMIPRIRDVKVPTLNVGGWWDQEDFYGPLRIYEALEQHDSKNLNRLVVGSRRLVARYWRIARSHSVRQRNGPVLPRRGAGPLVRVFPQGQRHPRSSGGADVRGRQQPMAAMGRLAAEASDRGSEPLFRIRQAPGLRQAVR